MLISSRLLLQVFRVTVGEGSRLSPTALKTARGGGVRIGKNSIVHCRFARDRQDAQIVIGDRCYIGKSFIVSASNVTIEDDVIISWGVTIVDHNSHAIDWEGRSKDVADWRRNNKDWSNVATSPVVLRRRCWIGFNVSILKGVTVGEEAVIGAGSVVSKDVPPFTVVAGNPARIVRSLI